MCHVPVPAVTVAARGERHRGQCSLMREGLSHHRKGALSTSEPERALPARGRAAAAAVELGGETKVAADEKGFDRDAAVPQLRGCDRDLDGGHQRLQLHAQSRKVLAIAAVYFACTAMLTLQDHVAALCLRVVLKIRCLSCCHGRDHATHSRARRARTKRMFRRDICIVTHRKDARLCSVDARQRIAVQECFTNNATVSLLCCTQLRTSALCCGCQQGWDTRRGANRGQDVRHDGEGHIELALHVLFHGMEACRVDQGIRRLATVAVVNHLLCCHLTWDASLHACI